MDYSLEQNDVWELVELSELLHQKELWILVLLFLICVANANKFRVCSKYKTSPSLRAHHKELNSTHI